MRVRYLPMKEDIHVFAGPGGVLRTDHTLAFLGLRFLTLRYEISAGG